MNYKQELRYPATPFMWEITPYEPLILPPRFYLMPLALRRRKRVDHFRGCLEMCFSKLFERAFS